MQELTFDQVEEVSGGNPVVVGIGIGIGASYVYDSMGGKEGIDNYFANSWASMKASFSYWATSIF